MQNKRRPIQGLLIAVHILLPAQLLADSTESAGTALLVALPITALGVSLKKQDTLGLKQYVFDVGSAAAVTFALKYSVNEKRPNGKSYSFPSEHTAFAFSSAGYLWRRYGYRYGIPAALAAGFVGYSRVEARKHYWHDVLAGAAIGTLSSYALVKPLQISCSEHSIKIQFYKDLG